MQALSAPVVGSGVEQGAAMVEFAFVLPLLALFAFGVIEFGHGVGWPADGGDGGAGRCQGRQRPGHALHRRPGVLLSTGAALNDLGLANVNWVVVFKSATADGAVPTACLTGTPHSVSGSCNAYSGAQLAQVVAGTSPGSWFGCGVGSLDLSWCPTARQSIQALGNDYLGVWVKVRRPMVTGFFGTTITIADHAVMRLEPQEA